MIAPIIPGLNENEVPAILEAAKNVGARAASYVMLRLPLTVAPVFQEWLERTQPLRAERVMGRVRQVRNGKINQSDFGERMTGTGEIAEQIRLMFELFKRRLDLNQPMPDYDCTRFRRPEKRDAQQWLF